MPEALLVVACQDAGTFGGLNTFIYICNHLVHVKIVTVRIADEDARALEAIEKEEQTDRAAALRKMISEGVRQWREARALKLLRDGRVTIRTAARMAGLSYVQVFDLAAKEGALTGYTLEDLRRDLREG